MYLTHVHVCTCVRVYVCTCVRVHVCTCHMIQWFAQLISNENIAGSIAAEYDHKSRLPTPLSTS